MQAARLERDAQRLAGAEQVLLADHLVERLRPQPFGQRRGGGVGEAEFERGLGHGARSRLEGAGALRFCRVADGAAGRDIRCTSPPPRPPRSSA